MRANAHFCAACAASAPIVRYARAASNACGARVCGMCGTALHVTRARPRTCVRAGARTRRRPRAHAAHTAQPRRGYV